jgi:hypothetical protein
MSLLLCYAFFACNCFTLCKTKSAYTKYTHFYLVLQEIFYLNLTILLNYFLNEFLISVAQSGSGALASPTWLAFITMPL